MIGIDKKTEKSIAAAGELQKWRDTHQEPSGKSFLDLCKENKSADDLWKLLDRGVSYNKEQLRQDLFDEQKAVCCYCVSAIGLSKGETVVEHFKDKADKGDNCDNIYNYYNLLLSCDGNNKTTEYLVKSGDALEDIAQKRGFSVDEIKALNPTTWNNLRPFSTRLKLPQPPHHCDKAKLGSRETIINPTETPNCWRFFSYDENGQIFGNNDLADTTIRILNLTAEPLTKKRKVAWENARKKFADDYDLDTPEKVIELFKQELVETKNLCMIAWAYLIQTYPYLSSVQY